MSFEKALERSRIEIGAVCCGIGLALLLLFWVGESFASPGNEYFDTPKVWIGSIAGFVWMAAGIGLIVTARPHGHRRRRTPGRDNSLS